MRKWVGYFLKLLVYAILGELLSLVVTFLTVVFGIFVLYFLLYILPLP